MEVQNECSYILDLNVYALMAWTEMTSLLTLYIPTWLSSHSYLIILLWFLQ